MFKNIIFACFLGLSAVILGAFGAHALKETLTLEQISGFETAVRYQMYHAIVLLIINLYDGLTDKQKRRLTYIFGLGVVFFSGSIYAIHLTKISAKTIWFITPLGGLFFIIGWILMIVIFAKKLNKK